MTRFLLLSFTFLLTTSLFSQNTNLSDYSFVVVPEQFDFLKEKDKYQINSMTKFYFEKNGFNAYMEDSAPNANRCDGLYADVEELKTILGTKLQIVLKDCQENEIYRGEAGKSKYKEFDKTYQDALRKAFESVEALRVNQKDVVLLNGTNTAIIASQTKTDSEMSTAVKPQVLNISGNMLPNSKFSKYSHGAKTFLLRKTVEGYSLYEESASAADGLLLKGKIIVMEKVVKFMDTNGKVSDANFDATGNLTIDDGSSSFTYKLGN